MVGLQHLEHLGSSGDDDRPTSRCLPERDEQKELREVEHAVAQPPRPNIIRMPCQEMTMAAKAMNMAVPKRRNSGS